MRLKKYLAKAMVFALVIGMTAVSPMSSTMSVMAETSGDGSENGEGDTEPTSTPTPTPSEQAKLSLSVSYTDYTATVTTEDDHYVFLRVYKKKEDKDKYTEYCYKVKEGAVKIDLSFLKAAKEQYIGVLGDVNKTVVEATISAQPAKSGMKYKAAFTDAGALDKYASFTYNKTEKLTEATAALFSYRTQYGTVWTEMTELDLENAIIAGTTIVVRQNATEDSAKDGKTTVGAPAGVEAKVKIAATAKAPKVTTDYVKGTIKLPKNAEFHLIYTLDDTTTEQTKWSSFGEAAATKTPAEILKLCGTTETISEENQAALLKSGFTMVVRTKANTSKGKTASALTFVTVSGQPQIAQTKDGEKLKDEITYTVGETTAKLTWEATEKGVKFTVAGMAFQYLDGTKQKALKVGTTEVKFTGSKEFTLSLAGVKENKKQDVAGSFASNAITVTLAPKATTTPTPTPETTKAATPTVENLVASVKLDETTHTVTFARKDATNVTATLSENAANVFEYSTDKNTWTAIADTPSTITIEGALAENTITLYVRTAANDTAKLTASDASAAIEVPKFGE